MQVTNEAEAVQMLGIIKEKLGRSWRQEIHSAWMSGRYWEKGLEEYAGDLQRIRNAFGPSWLSRVKV